MLAFYIFSGHNADRPRSRFLDRGRVLCTLRSHSARPRNRFLDRGYVLYYLRLHSDRPRSRFLDRARVLTPQGAKTHGFLTLTCRKCDRGRILEPQISADSQKGTLSVPSDSLRRPTKREPCVETLTGKINQDLLAKASLCRLQNHLQTLPLAQHENEEVFGSKPYDTLLLEDSCHT